MKTIDEALDYLYSFVNYETDASYSYDTIHYNVDRTVTLLKALGAPHRGMKTIHVAGTKGKGSVCQILSTLLRVQGISTGLFTSPHIERVNERISVNGVEILDGEIIELLNMFPPLIRTFPQDNHPTTFEILTAMAMHHFKKKGVSYAVLETGMGGRFDSTNFCDPDISIITSVSYDHMDKLGERIEQIAFEKAGIIKPERPVVVGYQVYDVIDIFRKKAREMRSPFHVVSELATYEIESLTPQGTWVSATIGKRRLTDLFISLPGKHQVENVLVALVSLYIIDMLPGNGKIRVALREVFLPARLEYFELKRRYLLDSAHNGDSARVLAESVRNAYRRNRLFTVVGIVKGKDVREILAQLAPISDELIVTEPLTHKELDTEQVFTVARELFPGALLMKDIHEAIGYAEQQSCEEDLILITGSFYTTAPARSFLLERAGKSAAF
ncbi:MAG: hypothetical protein AMS17_01275 [Spirochaetes bacterium DG_61]|jgi:dihydrofolate synthase/folylpolyglutamate synthase|nr:MAG: hypothetical protein AMS17_01275 [Spirochaetes bacterium DG_61]